MKKIRFYQLLGTMFMFISCSDNLEHTQDMNKQTETLVLTSEEYASIAYENPKELSETEIAKVIHDFRNIHHQFRSRSNSKLEKAPIEILHKYYLTNNQSLSRSEEAEIKIPIFEVEVIKSSKEKDLTVVCGDERAPKVLCYAENYEHTWKTDLDMKYLTEITKHSILADIKYIENLKTNKKDATLKKISEEFNVPIEQITKDFIRQHITITDINNTRNNPIDGMDISEIPSRIITMVPPMSEIAWKQEAPYNSQMPIGYIYDGYWGVYQDHYLVGCANIAIATLFSILKPAMVGETMTGRQILIDWDYLTAQQTITNYSAPKLIEMAASLLRTIYNKTHSFPEYTDVDTYDEDNNPIVKKGIVSTSTPVDGMLEYLQAITTYSGGTGFNPELAKQSLQNYNPILLYGKGHYVDNNRLPITEGPYTDNPGHGWIIDGYCITKKTGSPNNDLYWSVNMGWGQGTSTVYFNANNGLNCDVIFRTNRKNINIVYYTQEQQMIYDIQKK